MIKFSICTPTLNEEKYIGGLLDSLVQQKLKNFDVIVVDGKSKDKTKEAVIKYADALNLKFISSPKRGVSFQRNYAAKQATSDWIIFFDADVKIKPDFLWKISKYLEKHPNTDILTSWAEPISDKPIDDLVFAAVNILMLEMMKKKRPNAIGHFICVKKKSFWAVGGFREHINFAEDFDLSERMHSEGYKYVLLKTPKVKVSVRRFNKEGRFNMIIKNMRATIMYLAEGDEFFDKVQGKIKHEFGEF
jgi:glycosyltransferase involved in cell wall biosynthesis